MNSWGNKRKEKNCDLGEHYRSKRDKVELGLETVPFLESLG